MVKVTEFGMTRREEIVKATKECREDYVGLGRYLTPDDIADAFKEGIRHFRIRVMKMWIARDFGGGLYLFPEKPIKLVEYNCWDGEDWYKIDQDLFPEVTFDNSPQEVELKLIEK